MLGNNCKYLDYLELNSQYEDEEPNQDELIAEKRDAALLDAERAADDISRLAVEGLLWTCQWSQKIRDLS